LINKEKSGEKMRRLKGVVEQAGYIEAEKMEGKG